MTITSAWRGVDVVLLVEEHDLALREDERVAAQLEALGAGRG